MLLHDSEMSRAAVVAVIPLLVFDTLSFAVVDIVDIVVVVVGVLGRFEEGRFGVDAVGVRKEEA